MLLLMDEESDTPKIVSKADNNLKRLDVALIASREDTNPEQGKDE